MITAVMIACDVLLLLNLLRFVIKAKKIRNRNQYELTCMKSTTEMNVSDFIYVDDDGNYKYKDVEPWEVEEC